MPRKGRRDLWKELPVELTVEEKPDSEADDLPVSDETIETTPITEIKEIIDCCSFSEDNNNVNDEIFKDENSKCIFAKDDRYPGYCFLNHPKIENNQILKWSIGIGKMRADIGPVTILYKISDRIKITQIDENVNQVHFENFYTIPA